jgi:signal transduction histidine kinase
LRHSEGGTGLGLAVCYSIVKDHDGWIVIDDAPGGGSVFAVYLPASE